MEEDSALLIQLGMHYLGAAWLLRSPEGLCFPLRAQVAQSSVPVGMKSQELGTACAYGQGEGGGGGAPGRSVVVALETRS